MRPAVALVHPPTKNNFSLGASIGGAEHLGISYLAASLQESGYQTDLFNFEHRWASPETAKILVGRSNPVWVGLSPTSFSIDWCLRFCRILSGQLPLVFGGHLASNMGREFFSAVPWATVVVKGDGEGCLSDLTEHFLYRQKPLSEVKGIFYRDQSGVHETPPEPLPNLNDIRWPVRSKSEVGKTARMMASRGCPFSCSFCTTPTFYQRNVRYRPVMDVVEEMSWLNLKFGTTEFVFNDDLFPGASKVGRTWLKQFTNEVTSKLPEIKIRPLCRADVLVKRQDVFKHLLDIGLQSVFVGLESGNDKGLAEFNKCTTLGINRRLVTQLKENQIPLVPGFIMFSASSTFDTLQENLDFLHSAELLIRSTPLARTCLYFPGTSLYQENILKENYDDSRSNVFLMYPKFLDKRIREVSIAFAAIEQKFSIVDQQLLQTWVRNYSRVLGEKRVGEKYKKISSLLANGFEVCLKRAQKGDRAIELIEHFEKIHLEIKRVLGAVRSILRERSSIRDRSTRHRENLLL